MQIAYMLGSLNRGGTETLLLDCFRNATQAGFPFIGIYRKEGTLSADFKKSNVPLYKITPKFRFDIGYLIRLRKLIIAQQITHIHAQQPLDAIYARLASAGTSVRIILTLHGFEVNAGKMEKMMLRWIVQHTHLNIFVSDTQKRHYQQHYSLADNHTKTVYNGIAFDKLEQPHTTDIRKELKIKPHTLLLGSVGNFVAGRDQLTLCRFLKLLHAQNTDFEFLFVGARNAQDAWRYDNCVTFCKEAEIEQKVHFLGTRTDVPAILSQLDAFVYATDHDTFGIAVIEAMASGIPVFVNDWQVMQEITGQGEYASIYRTKEAEDLLQHFNLFLSQRKSFEERATAASSWARQQYSISKHLQTLKEIYELKD